MRPWLAGIRGQLIMLVAIPLVFLIAFLVLSRMLQHEIERAAMLSRQSTAILAQSDAIVKSFDQAGAGLGAYYKDHQKAARMTFETAAARIPVQLDELAALVRAEPESAPAASRFSSTAESIISIWTKLIVLIDARDDKKVVAIVNSPAVKRLGGEWQTSKLLFDEHERVSLIGRLNAAREHTQMLGAALFGLSLTGIALTLVVTVLFGLRIVRRLHRLGQNARDLAEGRPTALIVGRDEIAELDAVYHEMARRMASSDQAFLRERAGATILQRALLPQFFPRVPGLRIDCSYDPAAAGTEIGGDWYDVFELPDGRVGISVGDVAGHGLRAAALMGSIRQSLRAAATFEYAPSAVLQYVNRTLCKEEGLATALFGVLDLEDGSFRHAIAGHAPPILALPNGTTRELPGGGMLLGVDPRTTFEEFHSKIEIGSGLVLFTDGVVEVERNYFAGIADLHAAVVAEYFDPSENIADGIRRRVMGDRKGRDDSAILFIGVTSLGVRTPSGEQQRWHFEATNEDDARRVKRAVLWELAGFAASSPEFGETEAILGELLGNVVRHSPGEAVVRLERRDASLLLHVEDRGKPFALNGRPHPDPFAEHGRGLLIVQAIARDVVVGRTPTGNRVSAVLPISL